MSPLAQILTALLGGAERRRMVFSQTVLLVAAMAFALLAMVFCAIAFYQWLAFIVGPAGAAALTAGVLVFLSVLLLVIVQMRRPPPRAEPEALTIVTALLEKSAATKTSLGLAAILAGFAVGYSPTLRRLLKTVLKQP